MSVFRDNPHTSFFIEHKCKKMGLCHFVRQSRIWVGESAWLGTESYCSLDAARQTTFQPFYEMFVPMILVLTLWALVGTIHDTGAIAFAGFLI